MPELKKLGKYEIKRALGKGAMGVVYEGFDPFVDRTVAIKTVDKSTLDSSVAPDMLSRFRREAQAAGSLSHPNIVSIYEYGEDQDMAFIAMELIHGKELKAYFDSDERFLIKDTVRIMSQLLKALDYSHGCGVVHRDIKPSNIIIDEDGQVKVTDFGIAKIESSHLTQDGTVIGTPSYMSPEQIMGLAAVDRRTDIYSCGVILYQFLTGERPFTGSVVSIMHKALHQDPVPPSVLNFSVTSSLDAVVKMAMAKHLECRFQTAREFDEALMAATANAHSAGFEITVPHATFAPPNTTASNTTPLGDTAIEATSGAEAVLIAMEHEKAMRKTAEENHREPDDDFTLIDIPPAQITRVSVEKKSPAIAISAGLALLLIAGSAWFARRPSQYPTPVATIETPAYLTQPQAPVPAIQPRIPAKPENNSDSGIKTIAETTGKSEPLNAVPDSKNLTDKAAAEKVAAEKAAAEKVAAEKVAAEKVAAEKVAAEKVAAEKVAAEKVAAEKVAAEKAAAEKAAADKVAADKADKVIYDPNELYQQGLKYENKGNLADAMKNFLAAAKGGHGPAMKKLGDIYGKGNSSVPRDYATSIKWYHMAKQSGITMDRSDLGR